MAPQDSFIDEDDDSCPLCVEEFDPSDKNFRPCPCGYQVCQFCFNNIKNNMNGLCPACRRPYDDKTIEWKVVTQEEMAQFRANVQKNAKKKAEQRQKEAQKREVESLNRKHLSGLRVVQKNLVYVMGLQPGIREEEILQTLRGDKYFGQYGKIIKIVVSKAKQGEAGPSGSNLGVYVTFAKKEDAARCIAAVNGSQNGERVLRAQLGTTKYCSAYLRNETCTNKQCMFLHEPGDNDNSYSRQDLSAINSANEQLRPRSIASSSRQAQAQAPTQQTQPIATASQPMAREASKDGSDSGDGSALPSSASWAKQRSRRGSHATSVAASSPAISQSLPVPTAKVEEPQEVPTSQPEPEVVDSTSTSDSAPVIDSQNSSMDPLLSDLLKSIKSTAFSFTPSNADSEDLDSFPPLFDDHGGERRRAMREHQEDSRLHIEQDSQADLHSVPDTLDEEEPESGSLQLGGEPEDREGGREPGLLQNFHTQRRPSTQLPIQRSANGGPFGPSLGQTFPQNLGNLSSINGRALTPMQQQQIQLLKSSQPQSGFADQFPPGMSQPSALFQQQGHNRQSSRYSFANESASSAAKPAANAKFLAQQSSMMPSGSHAQQGNQFYGSTMPGPPPGLKSSGTPPISGMFGQGRSFGASMGGSSLYGGKDNSSEFLREMARGRGMAGSAQIHDAGKREFISSFLQQYPSASSTPAPSSSLQASLYGPQAGAFLDFGQKQKKKGKKHRHANTSSSGGGGLVDLADPSILQARMQHQQQSNAGVGQGLFGGQAQDDSDLPFLAEASSNVDALVADVTNDEIVGFPVLDPFGFGVRSSTPSIPPGFGPPGFALPHSHPEPALVDALPSKPPSRILPTSAPFTPSRTSSLVLNAVTPLPKVPASPTPAQVITQTTTPGTSTSQAKYDVKVLAGSSGLSKTIASHAAAQVNMLSEDFPALGGGKAKPASTLVATKTTLPAKAPASVIVSKKLPSTASATVSSPIVTVPKVVERRSTPGILNIVTSTAKSDVVEHSAVPASSFPPLPPSTPSVLTPQPLPSRPVGVTGKSVKSLPTPKPETPSAGTTPSSTTSIFPSSYHASKQANIASINKLERSGTPTSEIISDNASITSASISRANSPPPSKVGSAPVRANTKSMQKKQRKELQKEREKQELEAVIVKPEPEAEIGPIMGRKKKQKKERNVHSAAGGSTPAVSRPPSPTPGRSVIEDASVSEVTTPQAQASEKQVQPDKSTSGKVSDTKAKGKAKVQRPPTPEPVSTIPEAEEEPPEKPAPTPASILQDLLSSGFIQDLANLSFLKSPVSSNRNQDHQIDLQSAMPKLIITSEDRAALLAGRPVRKNLDGPNRILLTPNGDCVRNLTPEEEDQYLALQATIAKEAGPAAFFSAKHHANGGFTLIGGRAVPNGPPAFFPHATNTMDPVSKIQRDEALTYINQYVLPSLSTNSQLEKALNANALDAEGMRSSESASWPSWENDSSVPHPEGTNGVTHEGILASGLESITAHFAVGKDTDRGQPLGNVSLLSLGDAENAMQLARKETEGLEKRLNALLKKNKRLLLGSGH